jgi:DNA (cytosine-5)-methyltransferase 1
MGAYYNEIEPYAAQWLRNLIKAGHIAEGDVDERSIVEVEASDLRKYDQCHFFAGIGVWSYALRSAGWADDRKVWTGSCPCQPFSVAGLGQGFADERHLWPVWAKLIEQCRPDVLFGEQVANNDALAWLDVVQADLEAADYAVGTIDLCAAGLGAPHLRQRLWWVADAAGARRRIGQKPGEGRGDEARDPRTNGTHARLREPERDRASGELANDAQCRCGEGRAIEGSAAAQTGAVSGYWGAADLIYCRDPGGHRYRPVEPGTFPLAHGIANRVGRLRATGNALVAPVAEAFVRAYMDVATGCG